MNTTAARTTKTITETVEVKKEVQVITLELTKAQAETLLAIGYRTAGCPQKSRRGHVDAISRALTAAGVKRPPVTLKAGLCFDDEPDLFEVESVEPQGRPIGIYKRALGDYQGWNGRYWTGFSGDIDSAEAQLRVGSKSRIQNPKDPVLVKAVIL